MDIYDMVISLSDKDNNIGCGCMKELVALSETSDEAYAFFDDITSLLNDKNSYRRNRALSIISALSKWDTKNKIDKIIDSYLTHITDDKPITARICIQSLPEIAKNKPALRYKIIETLKNADTSKYKDSMRPLIEKDIIAALDKIKKTGSL